MLPVVCRLVIGLCLLIAGFYAVVFPTSVLAQNDRPAVVTQSLFDGETLQGWTVHNDAQIAVEEKLLVLKAGNGWLRSDLTYGDFVLHIEWKALKEADYDSGIYIRTGLEGA